MQEPKLSGCRGTFFAPVPKSLLGSLAILVDGSWGQHSGEKKKKIAIITRV